MLNSLLSQQRKSNLYDPTTTPVQEFIKKQPTREKAAEATLKAPNPRKVGTARVKTTETKTKPKGASIETPDGTFIPFDGTQAGADKAIKQYEDAKTVNRINEIAEGKLAKIPNQPGDIQMYQDYLKRNNLVVTPDGKEIKRNQVITQAGNQLADSITTAASTLPERINPGGDNAISKFILGHASALPAGIAQAPFNILGGIQQLTDPKSTTHERVSGLTETALEVGGGKFIEKVGSALKGTKGVKPVTYDSHGLPSGGVNPLDADGALSIPAMDTMAKVQKAQPEAIGQNPFAGINPVMTADQEFNLKIGALKGSKAAAEKAGDFAKANRLRAEIQQLENEFNAKLKPAKVKTAKATASAKTEFTAGTVSKPKTFKTRAGEETLVPAKQRQAIYKMKPDELEEFIGKNADSDSPIIRDAVKLAEDRLGKHSQAGATKPEDLAATLEASIEAEKAKKGLTVVDGGKSPVAGKAKTTTAAPARVPVAKPQGTGAKRQYMLGGQEGARASMEFASKEQEALYDLGSAMKNTRRDRGLSKESSLYKERTERINNASADELSRAATVYDDVRSQMKGAVDGEHRVLRETINTTQSKAPVNGGIPTSKAVARLQEKPVATSTSPVKETVTANGGKEAWQMTSQEFWEDTRKVNVNSKVPEGQARENIAGNHRFIVGRAVAEGKPVPDNVRAEYPDLAPTPPTAPIAEAKGPVKGTPVASSTPIKNGYVVETPNGVGTVRSTAKGITVEFKDGTRAKFAPAELKVKSTKPAQAMNMTMSNEALTARLDSLRDAGVTGYDALKAKLGSLQNDPQAMEVFNKWASSKGVAQTARAAGRVRVQQRKEEKPSLAKIAANELKGVGRTLQATGDVSGSRNVKMLGAAHPGLKVRTEGTAIAGTFNKKVADDLAKGINNATGKQKKLYDAISWDRMDGLAKGESAETFESNIGKVKGVGALQGGFERNFSMKTNGLRKAVADSWLKSHPNMPDAEIESLGLAIDLLSSKGFKSSGGLAEKALNATFFSPKAQAAKFRAPVEMVRELGKSVAGKRLTPAAKLYARAYTNHIATGMLTLYLAKQAGHKVGTDPNSSDFGKIIVGNRRYDIWQGEGSQARIFVKAITGGYKGKTYDLTGDVGRWLRYKVSPNVNLGASLVTGQDAVGKDQSPIQAAASHITPLFWKDLAEGGPEESLGLRIATAILTASGGVTSQYREKEGSSSGRKG